MNWFQAILLGIVQGLTEFLPVSSSAHLALVPYWLKWNLPEEHVYLFGVLVQMGTLFAVITYFWKDLIKILGAFVQGIIKRHPFAAPEARLGWFLLLATLPAGLAGVALKDMVESAFGNPRTISIFLLITAALLFFAERVLTRAKTTNDMTWKDALWIGIAQAFALFPGISRSGATISGGLFRGLKREEASRFAFLLSIPIMVAAGIFSVSDLPPAEILQPVLGPLIVATVAAALVGYGAIRWMLRYVSKRPFTVFSIYCACVGAITLLISFLRH